MFRSAGVKDGCYVWTQDLVAFQRPKRRCFQLLKQVTEAQVQTPLRFRFEAWEAELRGHPDRLFASYILEGLRRGFRTGLMSLIGQFSDPVGQPIYQQQRITRRS